MTRPAPGEYPTTRSASTPPSDGPRAAVPGAKAREGLVSVTAPETSPALSGFPTARLVLPADAPEDQWHAVRRAGVGGSDVAAILGMDRYRGPLHVWRAKRGQLEQEHSTRLDRAARRGHRLEGLVAEFFAEETGHTVVDAPGTLQHIDHPHWLANLDRIAYRPEEPADPAVLECKSRTWRAARAENWKGDQAPDGPSLQSCWYMAVTGYRAAYVAGLVDDDFVWFRLERDEELIGMLTAAVDTFWTEHVLTGVPPEPDGSQATTELLARLWDAQEEATVEVDPVEAMLLKQRRRALKERIETLGEDLNEVENQMRTMLGRAEVATVGGRTAFTWRQNGNFAPARFRQAEPALAAEYVRRVPVVDTERLAADHPETYRKYRARVLRAPSEG
ncbi:YqaJ viral recombinase family protein [Streptomyces umbrinus]|uniref:YqaJ viral recombinase family nuclease n=1 Tax=Streptomyces umbrinus TaxID=67370 RepID=UPI00342E5E36